MKSFFLSLIFTTFCFAVNAQKFTDKINVKKGQTTEVVSVISQSMNMGMEMTTKSTITSIAKVMEVSNSDFKINIKLTKMKNSTEVSGSTAEYDSEKPDSENTPEMVEAIKGKLNEEKEYSVNRSTLVSTDITAKNTNDDDPMEAISKAAGGTGSPAAEMFFIIPQGKKAGESWKINTATEALKTENNYTLLEVKGDFASIDYKTVSTLNLTIPVKGNDMTMNMKINSTGNLIVNIETGFVKRKTANSNSEGTMEVMGQTIPLVMDITGETTYNTK